MGNSCASGDGNINSGRFLQAPVSRSVRNEQMVQQLECGTVMPEYFLLRRQNVVAGLNAEVFNES
jgi:hypothetical protein